MAKEKIHELPQTKGIFQVSGIVSGVKKEKFYTEKETKTGKQFRSVNFGIEYEPGKTIYISLNGMPRDNVYLSKKEDKKTVTKKVAWKDRMKKDPDGYSLIGVRLGLTKDADGKNEKVILTEYDACKYINENLEDGMSVFIKGNLEYSSFINQNGEKTRSTKFIPTQISLYKNPIDFDADDFKSQHDFQQTIVFNSVEKEMNDDKPTGRFIIEANIVNYNSIETAEFVTNSTKLATNMRKKLKPYNAIQIFGKIDAVNNIEEVEETYEDDWGDGDEKDAINEQRVGGSSRRELRANGVHVDTLDNESYTENAINAAIKKATASKKAEENFAAKSTESKNDESDWGDEDDGFDDSDEPW